MDPQGRSLVPLKEGITYGPVPSRRLGASLGINLLPAGRKICPLDCAYCHYGWTTSSSLDKTAKLPTVKKVLAAVTNRLGELDEPPRSLTFSGNGEPTLHPAFPELVDGLTALRDRLCPATRTAILTNGVRVHDPIIRTALQRLDDPIVKLDAADGITFARLNRPAHSATFDRLLTGLRAMVQPMVQTMLVAGAHGNDDPAHLDRYLELVTKLAPREVHLYTLSRGYPSADIRWASPDLLKDVAAQLTRRGLRVKRILPPDNRAQPISDSEVRGAMSV